jgi:two-component system OmpR family response regulator
MTSALPGSFFAWGLPGLKRLFRIGICEGEWAIMDLLTQRATAVVSKEQIEEALYAFGSEIESNSVEVHVSRLRKKLGREAIETLRGVGYRLGSA